MMDVVSLVGRLLSLVGIGYSAIAAHRKEWGLVLVLAWVSSVFGALFVSGGAFIYTSF